MIPYSVNTKPAPAQSGYDHGGEAGDHSVISKIVSEHGPAVAHHAFSDGKSQMIVSHHADGHTHLSLGHPDFGHAMQHIGIAHGETS